MSWSQDTTSRLLITNKKYMTFLYTLNKPTPPKSKNKKKNNDKKEGNKIDEEKKDNKEEDKVTEEKKENVVKGILKENSINKSQENEVKNDIEDNIEKKDKIDDKIEKDETDEKKDIMEDKIDNKKDEKKEEDKIEDNKKDEDIEEEKKEEENKKDKKDKKKKEKEDMKEKKEQEKKEKKEKEEKEKLEKKKQKEKEEEKKINSNNNHNKFLSNKSKPMRPYLLAFLQAKDLLRGDVTISAQLGMKDVKKGLALRYGINVSVFHPSIDFLGHQHSIMLGLNCGVVVKYNLYPGDKYPEIINKCITEYEPQNLYDPITENQIIPEILPEIPKEDYQSDDEDYTKTKTDENLKDEENKEKEKVEEKKKIEKIEEKEIKEKKKIVRREYFNCHLRRIIFIGFIENFTTKMVTVDESGVIVMWLYNKNAFSGYVWYLPQNRYRLNLKYNIYVPMEDSEVYKILDMPNITLNQQYDKCFQESLKVFRDLQDNHKLNVYYVLQKEGECEVYIKYI